MNKDKFFQQLKLLYGRVVALQKNADATPLQHQERLPVALEELNTAFEELQVAEEELRAQNEQLGAARESVEAERQRYQDLFEFAPEGYLVTDAQGKIQEANCAAAQLLNIEQQVLVGKPLINFIPPPERRDFRTKLNQVLDQTVVKSASTPVLPQEWEVRLQPRALMSTLPPFNASMTVSATYNQAGQLVALRWLLRNVTARKQVEERLRLLESVAVNTNEAVIITESEPLDEPGPRILYVNEAFTHMTGYSQQEVLGKSPRFMQGPHTDRSVLDTVRAALEKFEPVEVELLNNRKDGSKYWVELSLVPVADETGYYTHWISVQRDITERKQADAARTQLIREQIARGEAETANRMKDEFLSVLSHEIRTPLNAILGWANLLRSRTFDQTTTARALETIERNARAQAQLVDDLLDVSRIIRGKLLLDIRPVELVSVIEAAIETVRPAADAKSIQLIARLDNTASLVSADYNRLQQVVWNLLSNAIKFTSTGGQVEVSLERFESSTQIRVSDTGIGISSEFLPYIFEHFRQADSTPTRSHGGLGLGLAIVRHLVELQGGTVQVESAGEAKGAMFTVTLPLRTVPTGTSESDSESLTGKSDLGQVRSATLRGLRVLVVDDEADARKLLTTVLEQAGARVTIVASAPEAVEVITGVEDSSRTQQFDVLLSDIGMPGEDGYTLIRKLRARSPQQERQVPAVALTAYAGEEYRTRALAAGFQAHVSKPIKPSELIAVVASLVKQTGRARAQ